MTTTDSFLSASGSSPPEYAPPLPRANWNLTLTWAIGDRRSCNEEIPTEQFRTILSRAGRTRGPEILFDHLVDGLISDDTVTAVAGDVWSDAEYPQSLSDWAWRFIFSYTTSFTVDGVSTPLPTQPIRLYRGCAPERRRGFAWTSDVEVARRFATTGFSGRRSGNLYRVDAPQSALRFAITDRDESEYVIDTARLRLTPIS